MPPSHRSGRAARGTEPLHDHLVISCYTPPSIGKLAAATQGSNDDGWNSGAMAAMNGRDLRKSFEPVLRRVFHLYWRFARGMTLGVRAVVLDCQNRVFLVKHSYVAGWHLPGGGVETGETFREALTRELVEEGQIELVGEPTLFGVYLNSHVSPRDPVAGFLVMDFWS